LQSFDVRAWCHPSRNLRSKALFAGALATWTRRDQRPVCPLGSTETAEKKPSFSGWNE